MPNVFKHLYMIQQLFVGVKTFELQVTCVAVILFIILDENIDGGTGFGLMYTMYDHYIWILFDLRIWQ